MVAQLQASELQEGNKNWCNAMIFYVVGHSPTIAAVSGYIEQQWSNIGKPTIYWHEAGYFIVNFQSPDDMHTVLHSGPHMFYGKPAIVKPWSDKFDFHAEILRVVPLWVKLPNLPLNCWTTATLSRIGSALGVPICADSCTSRQLRVSFARLLVEIYVTKALPQCVHIETPDGRMMEQRVVYEWTPPFCAQCKKVGHDCAKKNNPPPKKVWVPKKPGTVPEKPAEPVGPAVAKQPDQDGWKLAPRINMVLEELFQVFMLRKKCQLLVIIPLNCFRRLMMMCKDLLIIILRRVMVTPLQQDDYCNMECEGS